MIDTRKQFQLQTGVFLKRPDGVTFDDTIHSRVSVDLKFAHFVMMYSAKVHVNINLERFTMQIMLLGRKCYPLDYFLNNSCTIDLIGFGK